MRPDRLALLAVLALVPVAAAGCGDDGSSDGTVAAPPATTAATTAHGGAGDHTADDGADHGADHGAAAGEEQHGGGHGGSDDGPHQMGGKMKTLARTEQDGMRVEVISMEPERFTVEEGDRTIVHDPKPNDNAHLMVTLTDVETGERIPYSSVQIALTRDGRRALDTRLWPMISRHVGTHYGENVALAESGAYEAVVTVGAPEVARHNELADRWTRPVKLTFSLDWEAPR